MKHAINKLKNTYIHKTHTHTYRHTYIHIFHWSNIHPSTDQYETCQEILAAQRNWVKKHIM